MHSYQHNIKTFNSATRHLTRVERSIYRDLIELYYDTEQPFNKNDFVRICRLVLVVTDDEKTALKSVLDEFFVLIGDFYTHQYCDEVIDKFKNNNSAKSIAGKASAAIRAKKAEERKARRLAKSNTAPTDGQQTVNTCSTSVDNHKTIKQETIKPVIITAQPESGKAVAIATAKTKGTRLTSDWQLPKASGEWALSEGFTREMVLFEADKFRDYWISKSGRDAVKLDWDATWRNWIRNSKTNIKKTFSEQKQDYLDGKAKKFYEPLLTMTDQERKEWGFQ